MNTGEVVRDEQGLAYAVGPLLGRGLWGKTYSVQTDDGMEWALKVPLTPKDLPTGSERLAQTSRKILIEMGDILSQVTTSNLMLPRSRFTTKDGVPCLLYPRNDHTLERRLQQGCSLKELLGICVQLVAALDSLPLSLPSHGNIHPRNIFLSDRLEVKLSDPITPTLASAYKALRAARNFGAPYSPPEVRRMEIESPQQVFVDTYSISMLLFSGIMASSKGPAELPTAGLNKSMRLTLQDRVQNRLQEEGSNPRFHARLGTALARFLNRALSAKSLPTPPFRFHDLATYGERLRYLFYLIDPAVTHVGKVLLNRPPGNTIFQTGEAIRFSCTIDCMPKIENFEEIACGLRLFDKTRNERVRSTNSEYTVDQHPTGRLRFGFTLHDLTPAQYVVHIAFRIRDSSTEAIATEGEFEVHPTPGWKPPSKKPERAPIPIYTQVEQQANPWEVKQPPEPKIVEQPEPPQVEAEQKAEPPEPAIAQPPRRKPPIIITPESIPYQPSEEESEEGSEFSEEHLSEEHLTEDSVPEEAFSMEDLSAPRIDLHNDLSVEEPSVEETMSEQAPLIVPIGSNATDLITEEEDVSEPEFTGPSGVFGGQWNAPIHEPEPMQDEYELENASDIDSYDSFENSPTIVQSVIAFVKNLRNDTSLVVIIISIIIVILLLIAISFLPFEQT